MQSAGGHLKEIQRALKQPVANLGMIFNEGTRRIRRSVGLDAPDLSEFVHSEFQQEAQQLSKNIIAFSSAVEHLLIKYTRDIIHEQILLNRLANATIDIYTMLVVLSRVTRALNKNISSADIEKNMARVICSEVNEFNCVFLLTQMTDFLLCRQIFELIETFAHCGLVTLFATMKDIAQLPRTCSPTMALFTVIH